MGRILVSPGRQRPIPWQAAAIVLTLIAVIATSRYVAINANSINAYVRTAIAETSAAGLHCCLNQATPFN